MGRIRDWVTGANIELQIETRSTLANPDGWLVDSLGGRASYTGKRVTVENALGIAPVWTAVSLISEQVGALPLKVYRRTDDGQRLEARQHRAWRMLHDKPNQYTPAGRFWQSVASNLLLWGNAYVEKRRGVLGIVDELWLIDPGDVTVLWDVENYTKRFLVNEYVNGKYRRRELDTADVLHIFRNSLDGIIGQSVISTCKDAFGTAMARDEFEGSFYKRGAVMSGLIKHPGKLSPEAQRNLVDAVMARHGGSGRNHGVGVAMEGADFVPTSHPLRELEFVAAQNLTRTDIATMFGLPPNMLGGSSGDSLTYATVEDNQLQLATRAIAPITSVISEAVSRDEQILPQGVHDCEFVLEAMLRGNAKDRAEFYKAMSEIRVLSQQEIRDRENYGPLPAELKAPKQPVLPGMEQQTTPPVGVSVNGNGGGT